MLQVDQLENKDKARADGCACPEAARLPCFEVLDLLEKLQHKPGRSLAQQHQLGGSAAVLQQLRKLQ